MHIPVRAEPASVTQSGHDAGAQIFVGAGNVKSRDADEGVRSRTKRKQKYL
ncbi:hypothetical protein BRYFOR_07285 [Marvinbryantia formatexigens DSM 14469]|uniref:Uncharacterized protein n=1 Tax=Marvinbryantia formatexigens DSM 14469 TaxID=478749 RepID=C6LF83_9FIRM|nr:hypothetical protein BRYFOR_07285 [Marvinbryantia formatexigens DSM 14469]